MKNEQVDVLVMGAGLTGLTVGYELSKSHLTYRIIERADRTGGVIQTIRKDGFMYESGPNTGILGSPELGVLLDELKDEVQMQIGRQAVKRRLILKNGRWQALPSGLMQAVRTPLFSFRDKIRILGEPFRKRGDNQMETLDQLVRRRMGTSFLDYAIDPFILGVYAGDPSLLVTRYAFPKLYALEQNYGSFIRGSMKKARIPKTPAEKLATREVFSFANGLQELVNVLERKTGEQHIMKSFSDEKLLHDGTHFVLTGSSGEDSWSIRSRILISTLNATHIKADVYTFLPAEFFSVFSQVNYAPTVEVVLGFRQWTGMPLNAFGGLIPHKEKRDLLGILFLSSFLPGRAPEGGALLTVFMGGVRNARWIGADEQQIRLAVEREVKDLMGLDTFDPDLFEIIRHPEAIPQYSFESEEKSNLVQQLKEELPGFILGGNALGGIGIADRVKQGVEMAQTAIKQAGNEG